MAKIKKAVIPVAGFGTRFLPATKAMPKEMLPIIDKPIIQYIVEEAVASGIEDIILVTGASKRAIEDHFDYNYELQSWLKKQGKEEQRQDIKKLRIWRILSISAKKDLMAMARQFSMQPKSLAMSRLLLSGAMNFLSALKKPDSSS